MKFNGMALVILALSLSLASPSYAWHSKMSWKETTVLVAVVSVGGIAILITSPLWLTAFGGYKLNKFVKKGFEKRFLGVSDDAQINADAKITPEEAARILARKKTYEWLQVVSAGISNIQNLTTFHKTEESEGLARLQAFIKNLDAVRGPDIYDIGAMLCAFRTEFVPDIEGELGLEPFRDWILYYQRNSLVPKSFLQAAKKRLALSENVAKRLFSVLYFSVKAHAESLESIGL